MRKTEKPKFLFVVRDADSECGGAFVAESIAEAKKMALREDIAEEWTQLRVFKQKTDVSTWAKGIADYKRCLREGVFSYVEDDCDICKKTRSLSCVLKDGRCVCDDCYEASCPQCGKVEYEPSCQYCNENRHLSSDEQ